LVDGELSEPERRELLSSLDNVSGGWRRCALAFLEAQSWKQQMQSIRRDPAVQASPARPLRRPGFFGGMGGTLLAMAASFTVALTLGLVIHDVWRPGAATRPLLTDVAEAPKPPTESDRSLDQPGAPPSPTPPGDAWQLVSVPVRMGPDGPESIQLPVREIDRIDEHSLEQFAPTVPAELLQAFERSGHEVRRSRRVLPYRLEDGRQLMVPFEEVELHFVGNSAYQ
jgi:hypothetical protein